MISSQRHCHRVDTVFRISSSPSINPSTRLSSCPRRCGRRYSPCCESDRLHRALSAAKNKRNTDTKQHHHAGNKDPLYCCKRTDLRSSSSAIYPNYFDYFWHRYWAIRRGSNSQNNRRAEDHNIAVTSDSELARNGTLLPSCIDEGSR